MSKTNILSYLLFMVLLITLIACNGEKVANENNEESMAIETVNNDLSLLTTDLLKEKLENPQYVIVDIRSQAEYNGWKLNDENRGGHIQGAVNFPLNWTKEVDHLEDLLVENGITTDKHVIVYDALGNDVHVMFEVLSNLGYSNVYGYEEGLVTWAIDENLPMESLANYEKLVYPTWVNELIKGNRPNTFDNYDYKIFEVAWGAPVDYNEGHIPGAYYLDTNEIEEEPLWNRKSDQDIEQMLLDYGITYDTTVILYGRDNMAAMRAASIMLYAGVEDVRILDGGYFAWEKAGFEIETESNVPTSVANFGVEVPARLDFIIDTEEAKECLIDENGRLVSIRSWEEHIGETSGYSYINPKGRIEGSVWGYAGTDAYNMEDYRNFDQTMRNYHELASNWADLGITEENQVSFYCGTGWRASEAFFAAYLMGWENISVYDGGWFEWSLDESNPIEVGEPTN
ncbi:hypothetical protein BKP45_07885 [Anaerobacillus alkalidiazotrophicus]|uniref:Rhodanese domain-containing protein n=1 Tax=Anaerobacillus alkalidiazotrophicus TaxID=472963 RepID=A0A1S2M7T6_9BACI|nr:sulfurtransferase [Anaerobacillus alkalidiazotrophicus]OIJ20882.1 hypothetical protein BKP45_07885 [Anaerobacillus alkalidiazotrophicus]